MEALINIQSNLKAPKGQYNDFSKFMYRSCEDILKALKPLLKEHNASLTLSDEILLIGDRYYVKATATISCEGAKESVSAYAREELSKKGMDAAQITGSVSSYARKYALNGMFAIDDTRDVDTFDNKNKSASKPAASKQQEPASADKPDIVDQLEKEADLNAGTLGTLSKWYLTKKADIGKLSKINQDQINGYVNQLKDVIKEKL